MIKPDEMEDIKSIRKYLHCATDSIIPLPDHILAILWREFSIIQQAEWIIVDEQSAERFYAWFVSGDAADAWA